MRLVAPTRRRSPQIRERPPAPQVLIPSFTVNLTGEPAIFLPWNCLIQPQLYERASRKEDICLASSGFARVALESRWLKVCPSLCFSTVR
jgi:hypothetical protein